MKKKFLFIFPDDFNRYLINFETMYRGAPDMNPDAFMRFLITNLSPEDIIIIIRLGRILQTVFREL